MRVNAFGAAMTGTPPHRDKLFQSNELITPYLGEPSRLCWKDAASKERGGCASFAIGVSVSENCWGGPFRRGGGWFLAV